MLTDPMIAWAIALVITTVFGFVMYARGYNTGATVAAKFITSAVLNSKRMNAKSLEKAVVAEYERQNQPVETDEE